MSGPFIDDPIVTIPGAVAALLVAYAIIWRKAIVPVIHFFRSIGRIADATPTLLTMAEEFHPNGGGSLRDVVDRIEGKVDDAAELAHDAVEASVATRASVEERLDAHLALPAWSAERTEVLARISAIESRQARIIDRVGALVVGSDTSLADLLAVVQTAVNDPG